MRRVRPKASLPLAIVTGVVVLSSQPHFKEAAGQERHPFNVVETSISDIHAAIQRETLTCEKLVARYIKRIETLDQQSSLNSVVVINPKAIRRAQELDAEFKRTGQLLPLHGIPIVVKDNYDTSDLPTTAGSLALKDSVPPDDAFQVRRLREAGAIVLCKSNMAEWAYSPLFTTSSIAGVTRNPYDLERVPAGSSGGTAAAVAANFGAVGLGTDTGNSIRGPSAHCALVGLRPTLGLTSRDGIVPLFLRNDIGGPMCRTVEDVARVLQVISGQDPNDPVTEKCISKIPASYLDSLRTDGLRGARIGVFRTLSNTSTADAQILQLFEQAIADLKAQGANVTDPFVIPNLNLRQLQRRQGILWRDTFRHDIGVYLDSLGAQGRMKTAQDIFASGQYDASVKNRLAASIEAADPSDLQHPYSADPAHDPARAKLLREVIRAMDQAEIDAFIFPTWNNTPRKVGELQSPDGNNSYHIPPHTGQPAITVPMGFSSEGLPAGLQIVARSFAEPTLLKLAFAYEQATKHRRPPAKFPELR